MPDPLEVRAARHRALGDEHRLAVVDALVLSDRTPSELQQLLGLASNRLAFHLDVLERSGIVSRHPSEGDRRRRYVSLRDDVIAVTADAVDPTARIDLGGRPVLFVCRRNAARSQLAAALWHARTGHGAVSAGSEPAAAVHRHAIEVARRHGLDLVGARPRPYDAVDDRPGLVVSVCDRARESGLPFDAPTLHWSVPEPGDTDPDEFERAYGHLARRIERLAGAVAA